jgi:hypothetical protein
MLGTFRSVPYAAVRNGRTSSDSEPNCDYSDPWNRGALVLEQAPFHIEPAGVAGERIAAHDAVAGNNEGNRIPAASLPDGDRGGLEFRSEVAVGARLAVRNAIHRPHYRSREGIRILDFEVESLSRSGFVLSQLLANGRRIRVDSRVIELEVAVEESDLHRLTVRRETA